VNGGRAPGTLRAAWSIAGNDLRRARRDRTALLTGLVAPLMLAVLIGTALGGITSYAATIGFVDADGSPLSRGIVDGLVDSMPPDAALHVTRVADEAAGHTALRAGSVGAVIVIPAGFGDAVAGPGAFAGNPPKALAVATSPRARFAGDLARSLADGIAARLDAARLGTATALAPPIPQRSPPLPALVAAATRIEPAVTVSPEPVGTIYRPIAFFGASMSVVFLFFTMGSSARSLLAEHAEGTLTRLRASPVSNGALLLGRSLSAFTVGMASVVTVWLVTTFAFGADWGDPRAVLAVMAATVLAIAGIGSLIAGVAGTVDQANSYTSLVAFVLALLGGSFQPEGSLPPLFQRLALFTPNGVSQRAFVLVGAGGAGLGDVIGPLAILLGIAVVTLTIGILGIRAKVLA
jgi:ABC-2 type transport system permease protein